MKGNPGIFKAYDIRGVWNKEMFPEDVYEIGLAMGTFFKEKGASTVYVGRDNRIHGEEIKENFVKGLLETGMNVVFLGIITTPMSYATWYLRNAEASVSITASHNPSEYNGFKAAFNKVHFSTAEYEAIRDLVLNQEHKKADRKGEYSEDDLWPDYFERTTRDIKLGKKVKVVLDCGNGTCSEHTEKILEKIGCEVIKMYCDHDGSFPNHPPYPQKEDFYLELGQKIKEENADMGIAMDGDGDRFGVYDESGKFVSNDLIGALIGTGMIAEHSDLKAAFNISTSRVAIDQLEQAGAKVHLCKTGYPFVIAKMKEVGALLGNEIAGHFFLKDKYYGFDDASYAAARFVEFFSKQNKTVSQLVASMPNYVSTPEFRVPCADEEDNNKFTIIKSIIDKFRKEFADAEIMDIDGVRVTFPDHSWFLIRNSNTEALITGRVEAKTSERLEELKSLVKQTLADRGVDLDWSNPIASH
ncbi:MAG: phosphomannomutase/phosphoglucomutase [Patescibacteria group bacterium]